MGFVLGESRGRKPCVFSGKVAPASDDGYLVCVRWVRLRSNRCVIGSSTVCCDEWLFMCA